MPERQSPARALAEHGDDDLRVTARGDADEPGVIVKCLAGAAHALARLQRNGLRRARLAGEVNAGQVRLGGGAGGGDVGHGVGDQVPGVGHRQGVAYHATARGIRAQIVMPLATPQVKVAATRGYGAEVILHGASYDEACDEALRRRVEEGRTFIHPFDDAEVIAGQGTIGLELLEQVPDIEAVVVPIGGGGLIGGIACALKETNPKIRVIGVEPEKLPSMLRAREAGLPSPSPLKPPSPTASPFVAPAT